VFCFLVKPRSELLRLRRPPLQLITYHWSLITSRELFTILRRPLANAFGAACNRLPATSARRPITPSCHAGGRSAGGSLSRRRTIHVAGSGRKDLQSNHCVAVVLAVYVCEC
jgi:hypothetical protein